MFARIDHATGASEAGVDLDAAALGFAAVLLAIALVAALAGTRAPARWHAPVRQP